MTRQTIRHAVEATFELDVIVDVDGGFLPRFDGEAFGGQGSQRGPVQFLEPASARALELAERLLIEPFEQVRDRFVERADGMETMMAQRRHDPTLRDLHADFDLGFVARLSHARWHDPGSVVFGHRLIQRIQVRLIAARFVDARFEVVGNQQSAGAAEELEHAHVPIQSPMVSLGVAST